MPAPHRAAGARTRPVDAGPSALEGRSLYGLLARSASGGGEKDVPPTTVFTKAVETIDNDYAAMLTATGGTP
jgi:hypothetical protein